MNPRLLNVRNRAHLANARPDWYKITGQADGAAEVLIYDEIGWLGVTSDEFARDLRAVEAEQITLRINSPGGSVFDGIAIHNAIRQHPATVTVHVDSLAASIASVIAMAGDRVVMQPHSQLMIHDASGVCLGNSSDMRELADLLDRQSDNIASVYADRAGGTPTDWRSLMAAETWFSADEAVEAGLADEVAAKRARREEPAEMAAVWDLSVFRHAGRDAAPDPVLVATASSSHHTSTENSSWDGPGATAGMPNEAATLRYCHAWRDASGDPDAKGSYKFPHHRKQGGPANLAACRNGLARLSGAHIPDGDKAGVEAHLRAHLKDGGADGADDHHDATAIQTSLDEEPIPIEFDADAFRAVMRGAFR